MTRAGSVTVLLPYVVAPSAWAAAQLGEAAEALDRIREGEQLLDGQVVRGHLANHGWLYQTLGRACLALGRIRDAERLGEKALDASRGQFGYAAHALHLLADVASAPDRFDAERGMSGYRQAAALAESRGMRPLVAHCHLGRGRLHRRTGGHQHARDHLTRAVAMYREMDMRFWLEQAEPELGQTSAQAALPVAP